MLWNRRLLCTLRFLCTLCIGFQEDSIYTLQLYLARLLLNGPKLIQKLTPGFKNHMRILDNFIQAVERSKRWNSISYFCRKNIFFQLKHYIQGIHLTLFSLTCVKVHQIPYVITQLLCIFLAQTLHTFYKNSPIKCKFLDFPLLALKFTNFLMSFSNKKVSLITSFDHILVSWKIILLYFISWNFICY